MADANDELHQLAHADPAKSTVVASDSPAAQALFERITMDHTNPAPTRRRTVALACTAAVVAIAITGAAIAVTGDDDSTTTTTRLAVPEPTNGGVIPGGGITPGGAASCVELYDQSTLGNREFAFDGIVKAVEGDDITFTVNEWYRGGATPEVTLAGANVLGGMTSAGTATPLEVGARLLVAGDGGFAWSCGFTQPYAPAVAATWADTFDT